MSTPNKNNNKSQSADINNNDVHLNTSPSRSTVQSQQQQQQQYGNNAFKKQYQPQQLNSPPPPQQQTNYSSQQPNRPPQQQQPPQSYIPPQQASYQQGPPFYQQGSPYPNYQPNYFGQPQGTGFPTHQQPGYPTSTNQQQPNQPQQSPQSPSSPNQQQSQSQQQNANRNKIKPSVNTNIANIPPRTHSAPLPGSEDQHPKGFTPEKRAPVGYIQQHPPQAYYGGKSVYGAPPPHGTPIYYQQPQPYGYYGPPMHPTNNAPQQPIQQTKKALEIIDPNTNEKVIISSPPKPSSTPNGSGSTSTTTNNTPLTTTGNTTPSTSTPTTPVKLSSFSSGNVNLRKKNAELANKSSTSLNTSTSDSTNTTPTKAETTTEADQSNTTSDATVKVENTTSSSSSSSVSDTQTDAPKKSESIEETKTIEEPKVDIVQPEVEEKQVVSNEPKVEDNESTTTTTTTTTTVTPVADKVEQQEEEEEKSNNNVEELSNNTSDKVEAEQEESINNTEESLATASSSNENKDKVEVEELEEWEKKGEEDFNLTATETSNNNSSTSTSTSSSSVPFIRNSGEKIVYSKEEMMLLKPKSIEEPSGPLKDLKNHIETNVMQQNLNRSGNKINPAGAKMNPMMNPNYPPQMNMKYPPQMNMKYPPKNFNPNQPQAQQQFKFAPGFQYQQQLQGNQQQMHQPPQKTYGSEVSSNREPVQPPISQTVNEKRWVPTKVNALNDSEKVLRKAKFILNKITPEKFAVLTDELLQLNIIDDEKVHRGTIDIIFEKALNESKFCAMYTDLCKKIFEFEKQKKDQIRKVVFEKYNPIEMENYNRLNAKEKDEFDTKNNIKSTFRTFLLSTCQKEYEKIKFDDIDKVPEDLKPEDKADFDEQQFKKRKLIFGLIKFIGELFKQSMLSEKIIHAIMISLIGELNKPSEIKLECFCKLLSIVGKTLSQNEQANSYLTSYFQRMQQLVESPLASLSQRIRFLIQNVIDLKNNNWVSKTDDSAKTLKEVEATVNSNKNEVDNSRKSNTGVKSNVAMKNMFSVAFNNSFQPPKTGQPPMMNQQQPPQFKGPAMKQPAGFQPKPYPGYNPQNNYGSFNMGNMGGNMGNMGGNMGGNMNKQFNNNGPMGVNNINNNMNNNNNNISSSSSSPSSGASDLSKKWDSTKKSVLETISEFLELQDEDEFIECIKSYVPTTDLYPHVISQIITNACDGKNEDALRDLLLDLFIDKKFFTQAQFKSGVEIFISTLSDLFEDRPSAFKAVARLLYSFHENEIVTITQITTPLSKQLDSCGAAISKIVFEFVMQFNDFNKAASVFTENKVSLQSLVLDSNITEIALNYNKDLESFIDQVLKN